MVDKLNEIQGYREAIGDTTDDEFKWLIDELEKCRAEVKRQRHRGRLLIRLHRNEMSAQATELSNFYNKDKHD